MSEEIKYLEVIHLTNSKSVQIPYFPEELVSALRTRCKEHWSIVNDDFRLMCGALNLKDSYKLSSYNTIQDGAVVHLAPNFKGGLDNLPKQNVPKLISKEPCIKNPFRIDL